MRMIDLDKRAWGIPDWIWATPYDLCESDDEYNDEYDGFYHLHRLTSDEVHWNTDIADLIRDSGNEARLALTEKEHDDWSVKIDDDTRKSINEMLDRVKKIYGSKDIMGVPGIKNVIFNNPATIVEWWDGTRTTVTCQDATKTYVTEVDGKQVIKKKPIPSDTYDRYTGLAMCIVKKVYGNKSNFSNRLNRWIKKDDERIKAAKEKEQKHEENVKKNREQMALHEERKKKAEEGLPLE